MEEYIDVLFPALQKTLSDESDQVVQQCLVVIAEVISSPKTKSTSDNSKFSFMLIIISYLHQRMRFTQMKFVLLSTQFF